MDLMTLVQNFGFPIGIATFFIYMNYKQAKEHKDDLKDIAIKSVQAIDAATEAIKDSTKQIDQNNGALRKNSDTHGRIEVLLSQKGRQYGTGNGT